MSSIHRIFHSSSIHLVPIIVHAPRLTESLKAVIVLHKKFKSGEVSLSDIEKSICESDFAFLAYTLHIFCATSNCIETAEENLKGRVLHHNNVNCLNYQTLTAVKTLIVYFCSSKWCERTEMFIRWRISNQKNKKFCYEELSLDKFGESHFDTTTVEFHPLYIVSDWMESGTTNRRISISILLPSGVFIGQFSGRISDDGYTLELLVAWPKSLVYLKRIYRKLLVSNGSDRMELYHPELFGF